jgi:transcriptional regulator with XRE-family HTH domain
MAAQLGKWGTLRGATMLRAYFEKDGSPTQRQIASRLGVTEGTVYWWKFGVRRPSDSCRRALLRIANIPTQAWLTAKERTREKRLKAA